MDSTNLENVNFSSMKIPNLVEMHNLFLRCSSIISMDLSNIDASKVESMTSMF